MLTVFVCFYTRLQGFPYFLVYQYFTINYKRYIFFIKCEQLFNEYLIQHSLKSGGTEDHFRQVKIPGIDPYWKVWCLSLNVKFICMRIIIRNG